MPFKQIFKKSLLVFLLLSLTIASSGLNFNSAPVTTKAVSDFAPVVSLPSPIPDLAVFNYTLGYNSSSSAAIISIPLMADSALDLRIDQNYNGKGKFELYKLQKQDLLEFLKYEVTQKENRSSRVDQVNKVFFDPSWPQVTSFEKLLNITQYQSQKLALPMNDPGIYLLKSEINSLTKNTIVIRSKFGIVAKKTQTGMLFWGQDMTNGSSVNEGAIELYRSENEVKLLSSTNLDVQGLAEIATEQVPDFAVGEIQNQIVFVPLNLSGINRMNYYYSNFSSDYENYGNQSKIFVFTDRPIYKPGDAVKFKAIARNSDDIKYSIPPSTEFQVTLTRYEYEPSYKEIVVSNQVLNSDASGGIDGSLDLNKEASTSSRYQLRITVKGDNDDYSIGDSASFEVQNYVKPEFNLTVDSSSLDYISGDRAIFTVQAKYYSGQPVANQTVQYKVSSSDFNQYSSSQNLSQTLDYRSNYGTSITQGVINLDNQGRGEILIEAKAELPPNYKERYSSPTQGQVVTLQAKLDTGLASPATGSKNILVYNSSYDIFNKNLASQFQTGNALTIAMELTANKDTSNQSLTANQNIEFSGYINSWEKNPGYDPKVYNSQQYNPSEELLTSIPSITTNNDGKANLSFNPTRQGSYTITATSKDSGGRASAKRFYFTVTEPNQILVTERSNGVKINIDKPFDYSNLTTKYEVGDQMKVKIALENSTNDVLVTIEGKFVRSWKILKLQNGKSEIDELIQESYIPDMSIVATTFDGRNFNSNSARFNISTNLKKLDIQIATPQSTYKPGEEVNLDLNIKDNSGAGVAAQSTVMLIDKALLSLSDQSYPSILEAFWGQRYRYSITSDSLQLLSTENNGLGGGGGAGGITNRANFQDLAYWNPDLQTDTNGQGKINFKLPDNLTTWVILVYTADSLTRVGQELAEIQVSQDLVIRPIVPQSLYPGQELSVGMQIQNFGQEEVSADLSQSFDSGQIIAVSDKTILLAPGEQKTVYLLIKVGAGEKDSKLSFQLKGENGAGDSITVTIPVKQPTFEQKEILVSDRSVQQNVILSADAKIEKTNIQLNISPTLLGSLPQQSTDLINSPACSCTSLLIAKLQTLMVAKSNPKLFSSIIEYGQVDTEIKSTLAKLIAIQNPDGGWSSWGAGGPTELWTTTLVARILKQVKMAGFVIDNTVFENLARLTSTSLLTNSNTKAYAQIISNWLPEIAMFNTQIYPIADFDSQDPDLLAMAAQTEVVKEGSNQSLTDRLAALAQSNDREAFWEEVAVNNPDDRRFVSRRMSTALALETLITSQRINKNSKYSDLVTKAARYLANSQTQNTSYGIELSQTLAGQVGFFETTNQPEPDLNWEVYIDDKLFESGNQSQNSDLKQIIIDPIAIKPEGSVIKIQSKNDSPIYSTLIITQARTKSEELQNSKALTITRNLSLVNLDGSVSPVTDNNSLKTEDVVQVDLQVVPDQVVTDNDLVVIEENLPGGWEVINSNLATQSFDSKETFNSKYSREFTATGLNFVANQIPKTGLNMTYRARIVVAGQQRWLPASASVLGQSSAAYTNQLSFQVQPISPIKWQMLNGEANTDISFGDSISYAQSSSQLKDSSNANSLTNNRLALWIGIGLLALAVFAAVMSWLIWIKARQLKQVNNKSIYQDKK